MGAGIPVLTTTVPFRSGRDISPVLLRKTRRDIGVGARHSSDIPDLLRSPLGPWHQGSRPAAAHAVALWRSLPERSSFSCSEPTLNSNPFGQHSAPNSRKNLPK